MSNEALIKNFGNILMFADHAGDFGAAAATAANDLLLSGFSVTDVQMDVGGVAASGGARQSAKADFTAARPGIYVVQVCLEFVATVTAGGKVGFWMAPSNNATTTDGNVGNTSGADAAYTDETSLLGQMIFIGDLDCDDNNVIQKGQVGFYVPRMRYGNLVMVDNADQNIVAVVDEAHVVFTPSVYYPGA